MRKQNIFKLLAIVTVAIIAIAAFKSIKTNANHSDSSYTADLTLEESETSSKEIFSYDPQSNIGHEQTFQVEQIGRGEFDFSDYFGDSDENQFEQKLKTEYQGRVSRTLIDNTDSLVYYYTFETKRLIVLINDDFAPRLEENLVQGLANGVVVHYSQQGLMEKAIFGKKVPLEAQDFVLSLVAKLQMYVPATVYDESWSMVEEDISGKYEALYNILDQKIDGHVQIRKSRQEYTKLNFSIEGDFGSEKTSATTTGGYTYKLDLHNGRIQTVYGSEQILYTNDRGSLIGQNEDEANIDLVDVKQLNEAQINELKLYLANARQDSQTYKEAQENAEYERQKKIHLKRWADSDIHQVLSQLASITDLEGRESEELNHDLFLKLRSFTFLFPGDVQRITDFVQQLDPNMPGFETAMAALVNISSQQAQEAITQIIENAYDDYEKLHAALPAAGFVKNPIMDIERVLNDVSQNHPDAQIRLTADLSLGVMAGQLEEAVQQAETEIAGDEFKERLVDFESKILRQLENSDDPMETLKLLKVLGNFGSEKALALVAELMESKNEDVAAQAVLALRFQPFEESQDLLSTIAFPKSHEFQNALAESLGYMKATPEKFGYEFQLFKTVNSPAAKIQILENLFKARRFGISDVDQLLLELSEQNEDQNLKHHALGLLEQIRFESKS